MTKIRKKMEKEFKKQIKQYPDLNKAVVNAEALYRSNAELKQVILMRKDLKLPPGKMAAQAAHASVEAVLKTDPLIVRKWRQNGAKKVVLKVETVEGIYEYSRVAENEGLVVSIITDAGRTVIAPGTVTCCAIGPSDEKLIDKITGKLKMY